MEDLQGVARPGDDPGDVPGVVMPDPTVRRWMWVRRAWADRRRRAAERSPRWWEAEGDDGELHGED